MRGLVVCVLVALALLAPAGVRAADHQDSTALIPPNADPTADLADLFVWPSQDGSRVQIALTLAPFATQSTRFSQAVLFALHTRALVHYGDATPAGTTDILCSFNTDQQISCWVGEKDYVSGDASSEAGLFSKSGRVQVFAGPRADPFFFNEAGWSAVIGAIRTMLIGTPQSKTAQCPSIPAATSQQWISQLGTAVGGGAAHDYTLDSNVLALVLSIDRTLLLPQGASILSVWAGSYMPGGTP